MNPLSSRRGGGREVVVMIPDPDRRRRMLRATLASLGAAGVLWASLFSDQVARALGPAIQVDLDSGQSRLTNPTPPPPATPTTDATITTTTVPANSTTTTTTASPEQSQEQQEQEDTQPTSTSARPAGAYDEPEQAATAWYAHRGDVPADQVRVLQLDRHTHDTFTAFVTVEKDHRQHGALVEVVRVGGDYWQVSRLLQEG